MLILCLLQVLTVVLFARIELKLYSVPLQLASLQTQLNFMSTLLSLRLLSFCFLLSSTHLRLTVSLFVCLWSESDVTGGSHGPAALSVSDSVQVTT